jgi:hypothetical protein
MFVKKNAFFVHKLDEKVSNENMIKIQKIETSEHMSTIQNIENLIINIENVIVIQNYQNW